MLKFILLIPFIINAQSKIDSKIFQLLTDSIPEIEVYKKVIDNAQDTKFIWRIISTPDSTSLDNRLRNFYEIYIGESKPTHLNRKYTFYVNKDFNTVFFYKLSNDELITLKEWRLINSE